MRYACIYRNVWGLQHHRLLAHLNSPGPFMDFGLLEPQAVIKGSTPGREEGGTSNRNPKLEPRLPPYLRRDKQLQYLTPCPWPSVSRKENPGKFPKAKLEFAACGYLFTSISIGFTLY